ncbi:hypothetical protein AAE478_006622 [Parahypoxylon ruwenzoriense]
MCGRYSLALRPAQVRQMLQDDNMPVDDAPDDEGDEAPRQSYNFAPGYHGIVYRADVPDWGAGPRRREQVESGARGEASEPQPVSYKLQSMKWGLVPFWTKRNPDYGSMMKTINCRDDSLAHSGGMWSSMKARKRCVVVAQGFYEWLKKDGGREKIPHFVKRKDGKLMCFAGLWDVVQYESKYPNWFILRGDGKSEALTTTDEEHKLYTYTIITTDSNKQLDFLHDRMPVILENGSEAIHTWLDPKRHEWSKELQALLKPFDGELEVYPVSKDVGKVGNDSPTFIVPINGRENKSSIASFFAKGGSAKKGAKKEQPQVEVDKKQGFIAEDVINTRRGGKEAPTGVKREAEEEHADEELPNKTTTAAPSAAPNKSPSPQKRRKLSATSNRTKSPNKAKQSGSQKITKFFANSS